MIYALHGGGLTRNAECFINDISLSGGEDDDNS